MIDYSTIDLGDPVADHPLNRGLTEWWLALPGRGLGQTLPGLAGRYPGTLTGGATWAAGPNGFAGVSVSGGSYLSLPDWANLAAGDFTLVVVHTPRTWPGSYTALCDKGTSGLNRQMSLFYDTAGNMSYYGIGTGAPAIAGPNTGMTAGKTWHFVLTRTGSACSTWVNGVSGGTFTEAGTTAGTGGTWQFGANPSGGGTAYDGIYHEIRYAPRGVSQSEAVGLYDQWRRSHPDTLRRASRRPRSFVVSSPPTPPAASSFPAAVVGGGYGW